MGVLMLSRKHRERFSNPSRIWPLTDSPNQNQVPAPIDRLLVLGSSSGHTKHTNSLQNNRTTDQLNFQHCPKTSSKHQKFQILGKKGISYYPGPQFRIQPHRTCILYKKLDLFLGRSGGTSSLAPTETYSHSLGWKLPTHVNQVEQTHIEGDREAIWDSQA